LFPALLRVRSAALKTKSMSNLRQISLWMNIYSDDHNGIILPSQFDYSEDPYPGLVRTIPAYQSGLTLSLGEEHQGTWTDILWTENELGLTGEFAAVQDAAAGEIAHSYVYDSPDPRLYEFYSGHIDNILRSCANNLANTPNTRPDEEDLPRPFGKGARDKGYPGYFAANDNFNARADSACAPSPGVATWLNNAQITVPDRMMYLVDSKAGEIIEPMPYAFRNEPKKLKGGDPDGPRRMLLSDEDITNEVDFRYGGACLMLLMDGHVETVGAWTDIKDLEKNMRIKLNPFTNRR